MRLAGWIVAVACAILAAALWLARTPVELAPPSPTPAEVEAPVADSPELEVVLEIPPAVVSEPEAREAIRGAETEAPAVCPELTGDRRYEASGVRFVGGELVEVPHTFELRNSGPDPITFVSCKVTISTTVGQSRADFPLQVDPGGEVRFELVNKIRAANGEKRSRAFLTTAKGEVVVLELVARPL